MENRHLSDEELLRDASGELSKRRAAEARAHLNSCWECRTRREEIESAIRDFVRASNENVNMQLPPIAGQRALLKAQLGQLSRQAKRSGWDYLRVAASGRAAALVFALALLAWGGMALHQRSTGRTQSSQLTYPSADVLPKPDLTPGFTRHVTLVQICGEYHDEVERNVPRGVQEKVFQEYGMQSASPENYEVDYLITPGLGGADDIRNLWPEPHYDTKWNSYVKDQLENQLHQMVCTGKVNLATAQQDIARNWISAYKKYFHTQQPLPVRPNAPQPNLTSSRIFPARPYLWAETCEVADRIERRRPRHA